MVIYLRDVNDLSEVKIGFPKVQTGELTKVEVLSVNLKVIHEVRFRKLGSRTFASENPSGARYSKLSFCPTKRVGDRFAVCYVCSQRCTARIAFLDALPQLK